MSLARFAHPIRYYPLLPGFHLLMVLVMISIPFGELQGALLGGFSPAKIFIPLLFFYVVCIHLFRLTIHPLLGPYILFVVCTLPSLVTGIDFTEILISLAGYILLFQVLYSYSFSINKIRALIKTYIIGLTFIACLTLASLVTGFDAGAQLGKPFIEYWLGFPIVSGPSNNPNGFATLFIPGISFAFYCFLSSEKKRAKLIYGSVMTIFILTLILTFSRSGIAAALISCFVIHHHKKNITTFTVKLIVKLSLILAGIILLGAVYYSAIGLVTSDTSGGEASSNTNISLIKGESGGYRTRMIVPMLSIVVENPIIGVGYGNVNGMIEEKTGLFLAAHNTFFGIAMDYGFITLVFFCLTIGLSFRDFGRAVRLAGKDIKNRLLVSALFASLGGMMFHGLFHELYVNFMLWFLIAMGPIVLRSARLSNWQYLTSLRKT
ncbi:MAG: O-antigen ligase family protein [Pseudohongiellaceae bacterium]